MSIEQHKQIALSFFERFSAGDIKGVLDLLSDDSTYWILGRRDVIASAGLHSKERIARIFAGMMERLSDGLKMTVRSVIAEGDRVALEVESHGALRNGRLYNNQYHTLMRIRGDRIVEVREYLDTQHVLATWYD